MSGRCIVPRAISPRRVVFSTAYIAASSTIAMRMMKKL